MIRSPIDTNKNSFSSYLSKTGGISLEDAENVSKDLILKTVPKGTVLLKNGDLCHHNFFVQKGLLRSYALGSDGKEHVIQFAPENWFIVDRASVYFNDPSEIFIDAVEDSRVVLVDGDFMERLAKLNSDYAKFNDRLLHNHIRHIQKRLQLLLGASAEIRYLSFIEMYPDLLMRVPQWMIASYLGITPESLSRVRKELANKDFKARRKI